MVLSLYLQVNSSIPQVNTTRRYSPLRGLYFYLLRRALTSDRGFFCPWGQKRAFYAVLAYFKPFWCSVLPSVTFSSNLSNFVFFLSNKSGNIQKIQKNHIFFKISTKIPKTQKKIHKKNGKVKKKIKKSKNLKFYFKFIFFSQIWIFLKIFFFAKKKKRKNKAIPLVLPIEEISL